jgi:ABC-type transport system involved in cytochrome bd biosynthesis fused ATPase/permease subunit
MLPSWLVDEGDIVEQGTHEDLLAKRGFYAELYNSQFEVPQVSLSRKVLTDRYTQAAGIRSP